MSNYTYILSCADNSLYCGWTNSLEKRLASHNNGTASKYTRTRRPVKLIYFEEFDTKEEAMSREYHIKRMTRKEKLKLIAGKND
jgi:putative endonuclease